MRLFIAINFSDEIKSMLLDATETLKSQVLCGNFTRRENLHLTLAFIGETNRTTDVINCIDSVPASPFTLTFGGSGRFGDIWWAGIKRSGELAALAENLQNALCGSGFSIEKREFRPHVTLARELKSDGRITLYIPPAVMTVNRISLMKSERVHGRLLYTEIYGRNL